MQRDGYVSIMNDGLMTICKSVDGRLGHLYSFGLPAGCPTALAVNKITNSPSDILLIYDKHMQLFDTVVGPRNSKIWFPDRDASGSVLWACYIDSMNVVMISDTLGVILMDFRGSTTVIDNFTGPYLLNVATREIVHGCISTNRRYLYVLTLNCVHIIDMNYYNRLHHVPVDSNNFPLDIDDKLQAISCGSTILWCITRTGIIMARRLLNGGSSMSECVWVNTHFKSVHFVELIAKEDDTAFLTTLAGCVIKLSIDQGFQEMKPTSDDHSIINDDNGFVVVEDDSDSSKQHASFQPELLPVQGSPITAVDASHDSLLVGGADGIVRIWNLNQNQNVYTSPSPVDVKSHRLANATAHCSFIKI